MNQHMLTLYALVCDNALYELNHINHRTTKGREIVATLNEHLVENVVSANAERGYVFVATGNERDDTLKFKYLRGKVRIFVLSKRIKGPAALNVGGIQHNITTNRVEMCTRVTQTIDGFEYTYTDLENYLLEHMYGKCGACGNCGLLAQFKEQMEEST